MQMKAVLGTPTGPKVSTADVPQPGEAEILVKVWASSLNRADLTLFDGGSHGAIGNKAGLGLEWAGEIVAAGAAVREYKIGDRVMCSGIGGLAEYAVTDWRRAFHIPSPAMSYTEATCFPIALRTMHNAIRTKGQIRPGRTLLIVGATSGVGILGLQIARYFKAAKIIGTTTNSGRIEGLKEFGADVVINTRDSGWSRQVIDATEGRGVDIVIDHLAGPLVAETMKAAAIGARIVNVGRMAGETGVVDFNLHSYKQLTYIGVTFRTRSLDEVWEISRQAAEDLMPAISRREIVLPVAKIFPLEEIGSAIKYMRGNNHFGKIVLAQEAEP